MLSLVHHVPQAKAEPLSGKVERLITWRWAEYPVKRAESEEEAFDDDVITGIHKQQPIYGIMTLKLFVL